MLYVLNCGCLIIMKQKYYTTGKEQYAIFRKFFLFYCAKLHIFGRWEIREDGLNPNNEISKAIENTGGAYVNYNKEQRVVNFGFVFLKANDSQTKQEIQNMAFHEVLHILLAPLGDDTAIHHEVINSLRYILEKTNFYEIN